MAWFIFSYCCPSVCLHDPFGYWRGNLKNRLLRDEEEQEKKESYSFSSSRFFLSVRSILNHQNSIPSDYSNVEHAAIDDSRNFHRDLQFSVDLHLISIKTLFSPCLDFLRIIAMRCSFLSPNSFHCEGKQTLHTKYMQTYLWWSQAKMCIDPHEPWHCNKTPAQSSALLPCRCLDRQPRNSFLCVLTICIVRFGDLSFSPSDLVHSTVDCSIDTHYSFMFVHYHTTCNSHRRDALFIHVIRYYRRLF